MSAHHGFDYALEDKGKKLFAGCRKFSYMWFAKHTVVACKK
jgi:hypothetical protein